MNRRYLLTSLKIKLEKFQQPPKMKNEKKNARQNGFYFQGQTLSGENSIFPPSIILLANQIAGFSNEQYLRNYNGIGM